MTDFTPPPYDENAEYLEDRIGMRVEEALAAKAEIIEALLDQTMACEDKGMVDADRAQVDVVVDLGQLTENLEEALLKNPGFRRATALEMALQEAERLYAAASMIEDVGGGGDETENMPPFTSNN